MCMFWLYIAQPITLDWWISWIREWFDVVMDLAYLPAPALIIVTRSDFMLSMTPSRIGECRGSV